MKWKKLLMMPIVGLLLLGSVHTALAAEPVTAEIPVSVEIKDAAELTKAETFTITLRPVDGAPMPAGYSQEAKLTFTAAGKQSFPAIRYDKPGDYRYTLEQEISDKTVCWIDETRYEILVNVFVDETTGELKTPVFTDATGEQKAEEFKFVNSVYEPCIMDPPILKKVVDENGNEVADTAGTYTFRLEAIGANASTAPMPNGVGGSMDLTLTGSTKYVRGGDFGPLYEDSKGTLAEFGVMKYFEEGTWEYQISEVSASTGYTVDDEIYNVKIVVTRDDSTHKYVSERTVTSKKQGVIELAVFSFSNRKVPETQPETGPTPGGGGRRSRPETSNTPTPDTPTTPGEVLGAARDAAEDAGRGVLGAVRNPQVLGAVRTGDSSAMVIWAVMLMLAVSGIAGWCNVYLRRKRA